MDKQIEDEARRLARVTCGYDTLSLAEEANWGFIAESLLEAERRGAQRALREAADDAVNAPIGKAAIAYDLRKRYEDAEDDGDYHEAARIEVASWLRAKAEALSPHGQDAQETQR